MFYLFVAALPETFLVFALSILVFFSVIIWPLEGASICAQGTPWEILRNCRWSQRLYNQGKFLHNAENSEGQLHGLLDGKGNFLRIAGLGIQVFLIVAGLCWGGIGIFLSGYFIIDYFGSVIKICILLAATFSLLLSLSPEPPFYAFEFVLLLILGVTGLLLLVSSCDLLGLYLALELQSLSFYVLASLKRNSEFSTEAGLKYFIFGAFSSGFLLFGSSLIYGFTGSTHFENIFRVLKSLSFQSEGFWNNPGLFVGILFLISGLFFKFGLFPFHVWVPDVYEGSATIVTAFFAIVPKFAIFGVCFRLFFDFFYVEEVLENLLQPVMIFCALFSILFGTIGGLVQTKLKRLLAYSTVANAGYLFLGFFPASVEGAEALFLYLWIYLFTLLGIFSFLLSVRFLNKSRVIYFTDLVFLAKSNPVLSLFFALFLFSLAGIPPLAGFFGKFYVFFSLVGNEFYLVSLLAICLSVIGCFYYLRLIKFLYYRSEVVGRGPLWPFCLLVPKIQSYILSLVFLFLISFVFYPSPFLLLAQKVVLTFLL